MVIIGISSFELAEELHTVCADDVLTQNTEQFQQLLPLSITVNILQRP